MIWTLSIFMVLGVTRQKLATCQNKPDHYWFPLSLYIWCCGCVFNGTSSLCDGESEVWYV